jgi:tetratricopeptide (TPR) repeat protein
MIEDARIAAQLGNKIDLLQETLRTHRFAVQLNPENTSVLFNTGQVLSSLGEELSESGAPEVRSSARRLLEEAVDIFTHCLRNQENEYDQMKIAETEAEALQHGQMEAAAPTTSTTAAEESIPDAPSEYATVEEPVTPETLLETCSAHLGALTTLLTLYEPSELPTIDKKARDGLEIVNDRIPKLLNLMESNGIRIPDEPKAGPVLSLKTTFIDEEESSLKEEALLVARDFLAGVAGAKFRSSQTASTEYAAEVDQIFSPLVPSHRVNETLSADQVKLFSLYAEALFDVATTISDRPQYTPSSADFKDDLDVQWRVLSQAQGVFTRLSTGVHAERLSPARHASIYTARGDIELFRFRIALVDSAKSEWVQSRTNLLRDAGTFYRRASVLAEKSGAAEIKKTAETKAILTDGMKMAMDGTTSSNVGWKGRASDVERVLQDMVQEGILSNEIASILSSVQ